MPNPNKHVATIKIERVAGGTEVYLKSGIGGVFPVFLKKYYSLLTLDNRSFLSALLVVLHLL